MVQSTVMADHGFDQWHLGVVESISARDAKMPEGGRERDWSIPIASAITEFKFIRFGEELQPVVARDDDGSQGDVASEGTIVDWS